MKFLCVPCDQPMKLASVSPPEKGSLSVVYSCPTCGYEMAMLTNAHETQVVGSLGVKIGPEGERGGCPFSAMIPEAKPEAPEGILWTEPAAARLTSIPEFIRAMAKTGIERFAKERGYPEVDEKVLDEAREHFGM